MDTRIGYPNEHLSQCDENVANPLFSTSVGLVLHGFKELEAEKNRTAQKENITTHSRKSKGNFFDILFSKTKKLFEERDDEFQQ
ncbi:MAG: hypothetical protein HY738_15950 [Bacteroidia bacterium]|nr:hypothetical protein [Bacteroidia bacterium]